MIPVRLEFARTLINGPAQSPKRGSGQLVAQRKIIDITEAVEMHHAAREPDSKQAQWPRATLRCEVTGGSHRWQEIQKQKKHRQKAEPCPFIDVVGRAPIGMSSSFGFVTMPVNRGQQDICSENDSSANHEARWDVPALDAAPQAAESHGGN